MMRRQRWHLMMDAHCCWLSMRSDNYCRCARSTSIDLRIYHFSLWRLWMHYYFLDWTELFGTPSQSHLAMDAPQLRAQLASVEILLDQWLTWEFYSLCRKAGNCLLPFLVFFSLLSFYSTSFITKRKIHNEIEWNLCWYTAPNENDNFIIFYDF